MHILSVALIPAVPHFIGFKIGPTFTLLNHEKIRSKHKQNKKGPGKVDVRVVSYCVLVRVACLVSIKFCCSTNTFLGSIMRAISHLFTAVIESL